MAKQQDADKAKETPQDVIARVAGKKNTGANDNANDTDAGTTDAGATTTAVPSDQPITEPAVSRSGVVAKDREEAQNAVNSAFSREELASTLDEDLKPLDVEEDKLYNVKLAANQPYPAVAINAGKTTVQITRRGFVIMTGKQLRAASDYLVSRFGLSASAIEYHETTEKAADAANRDELRKRLRTGPNVSSMSNLYRTTTVAPSQSVDTADKGADAQLAEEAAGTTPVSGAPTPSNPEGTKPDPANVSEGMKEGEGEEGGGEKGGKK